jgi:very-short-patch-repair endonuclease
MQNCQPHHPAKLPEDLRTWAREMRGSMTDAEVLLWKLLRNRRVADAKFRRQHPMGRYILDFYCAEKNLCIELDGGQHGEALGYDHRRDEWLRAKGMRVLRFWNNQMLTETEAVLEVIYQNLLAADLASTLTPTSGTPSPSPASGRGEHDEGELQASSVVKENLTTAADFIERQSMKKIDQ